MITVISGSESSFEALVFRAFRDAILVKSRIGLRLVRVYYLIGPTLARRLEACPQLCRLLRNAFSESTRVLLVMVGVPQRAFCVGLVPPEAQRPKE